MNHLSSKNMNEYLEELEKEYLRLLASLDRRKNQARIGKRLSAMPVKRVSWCAVQS